MFKFTLSPAPSCPARLSVLLYVCALALAVLARRPQPAFCVTFHLQSWLAMHQGMSVF